MGAGLAMQTQHNSSSNNQQHNQNYSNNSADTWSRNTAFDRASSLNPNTRPQVENVNHQARRSALSSNSNYNKKPYSYDINIRTGQIQYQ